MNAIEVGTAQVDHAPRSFTLEQAREFACHGFNEIFFDADSTLFGIEGVNELARMQGPAVFEMVNALTLDAMGGSLLFDKAVEERYRLIKPHRYDIQQLGTLYAQNVGQGSPFLIRILQGIGRDTHLLSGGDENALRTALNLLHLNLDVAANELSFTSALGTYAGHEDQQLAAQPNGKRMHIQNGRANGVINRRVAMVGDGSTDAETEDPFNNGANLFINFTQHVDRDISATVATNHVGALLAILVGEKGWQQIARGASNGSGKAKSLLLSGFKAIMSGAVQINDLNYAIELSDRIQLFDYSRLL